MNVVLWIVQGLLAAAFLLVGWAKATQPMDQLTKRMAWASAVPAGFVRFIGVAELLGAVGLILPLAMGVLPWLTVAAAIGLVIVQAGAIVFHLSRGEGGTVPTNLILLVLAVFIIIGRLATRSL
jgi:hypothetical protein